MFRQYLFDACRKVAAWRKEYTGKVWHVTPPISVVLTLENGENQAFKIPEGQKFTASGSIRTCFLKIEKQSSPCRMQFRIEAN
jgi:hypothetical protein